MSYSVLRIFFKGVKTPELYHCKTQAEEVSKRDELSQKETFEHCEVHRHQLDIFSKKTLDERPYTPPAHSPVAVESIGTQQKAG